jgi:hypothetical protein
LSKVLYIFTYIFDYCLRLYSQCTWAQTLSQYICPIYAQPVPADMRYEGDLFNSKYLEFVPVPYL